MTCVERRASSGCALCRFAPSPNGRLHLGHAFSALFTARAAEALGGTFLLRIEDIDTARSKPGFDAAILEDLSWLGLSWPEPVLRQSSRFGAYKKAADRLKEKGLLYPCFCSRQDIGAISHAKGPDGAPLYARKCQSLSAAEVEQRFSRGEAAQWRLNMARALEVCGDLSILEAPAEGIDAIWHQARARAAFPEEWGDTVLVRKDTPASYHLSVVTDDAWQGITHVTRGMDLFDATGLHVLLQNILALPSPVYCHHSLIEDTTGKKLAKSRGSRSIADLRKEGLTASAIRLMLGFPEVGR